MINPDTNVLSSTAIIQLGVGYCTVEQVFE